MSQPHINRTRRENREGKKARSVAANLRFACLLLIVAVAGLAVSPWARGQGFEFGNYQVVSATRVGRTEFEYVMRVGITNKVAPAQGISAQVFSRSSDTVIVEGNVSFGDLGFGESAVGGDTFTLRQNRLVAFNPTNLQWFASVQSMALAVSVSTPVSGLLTNGTNVVVSGTVGPGVDGVRVGGLLAALTGTNFTAIRALEEGRNTISVLATNAYGGAGLVNVIVNRDTTPPILSIDTPSVGSVLAARQVTVTGQINDIVPGTVNPEQASVKVNGLPATILNRSYALTDVLLSPGKNTITVVGRDRAGNESQRQIEVIFQDPASQKRLKALAGNGQTGMIGALLPDPLVVELVNGDGVVQTNQPVTFAVSRNDGRLIAAPDSGRSLTVLSDDKGQARVLFQLGSRSGVGNNEVAVSSPGVAVPLLLSANATGAPPANVAALIPETQVGQTGKALPLPWTAFITDAGGNPVAGAPVTFAVTQGGGSVGGATTVVTNTDSDGRAFVIHTLGPDAGVNNNIMTASVPGLSNSAAVFTASGASAGPVNQTRVIGVVLDNANRPMSNILCRIENTLLVTVTDPQGQFVLSNAPVGAVRLNVDARNRGYPGEWHTLQFDLVTVAGKDNRLDRPIYLLPLDLANSTIAGGEQDVTLRLAGVPGSSLTIFAHSLRDPNNQPITNRVLWTQVNLERVPMAPPNGSQFTLAWTVQPINLRFNPPARVCLPNSGFAPGQVVEMFGFDHDINAFVSLGQGTVSSNGAQVCSNPGFGITKSGWGGFVPPPPPCTPVCGPDPMDTDCVKYEKIPPATKCDCPTFKATQKVKITKVEAKVNGKDEVIVGTNDMVNFSVVVEQEGCSNLKYQWTFGDGETSSQQSPTHQYKEVKTFMPSVTVSCETCPVSKSDDAKVIVGGVNLVIHKPKVIDSGEIPIPDSDKLTKGSQTFVNIDNDDNGTKFDKDDATVAGEDELVKLKLQIKNKDAKEGVAILTATSGGGDIKVWKAANKGTEYALGSALNVPADFTISGDMLEVTLYVEGINAQTSQQGTKLRLTYDKAPAAKDEVALTIIGLESITWEGLNNSRNDDNALDADPNWPGGLAPAGLRVFPDARREGFFGSIASPRDKVTVKARLTVAPVEPVKVYFRSLDVDDPTDAAAPIDDDTVLAEDNRGTSPAKAGKIEGSDGNGILEQTFDALEKTFKFQVTMQPGDNFRIVGNGDKDFVSGLKNDETTLGAANADKQRVVDPNVSGTAAEMEVRDASKYVTPTLTVWRFLHVEKDSMRALNANENILTTKFTDFAGTSAAATQLRGSTVTLRDQSDDLDSGTVGDGRFQNGQLTLGSGGTTITISPITNGQARAVFAATAIVPLAFNATDNDFILGSTMSGTVTTITKSGGNFIYTLNITAHSETPIDWPDFIGGTISVGGGDNVSITAVDSTNSTVTGASMNVAAALKDDDDRTLLPAVGDLSLLVTALNPAYILALDDEGGESGNNTQDANLLLELPGDNATDAQNEASYKRDADGADAYWVAYLLMAYQYEDDEDCDPNNESATGGIAIGAGLDSSNTVIGTGSKGTQVFRESIRDRLANTGATVGLELRVTAHEIGHQLGLAHVGGGNNLMLSSQQSVPNASATFVKQHLHELRTRIKTPGQ